MSDMFEPTDRMIQAAARAGQESGLWGAGATMENIARAMLKAAMEVMPRHYAGPKYPFQMRNTKGFSPSRVRIVSAGDQPGYFRIECEDGRCTFMRTRYCRTTGSSRSTSSRKGR